VPSFRRIIQWQSVQRTYNIATKSTKRSKALSDQVRTLQEEVVGLTESLQDANKAMEDQGLKDNVNSRLQKHSNFLDESPQHSKK